MDDRPIVPVVLGPTGIGKTRLLCELDADRFEVVSCDSRQLYRGMEIGTAAPTPAEQSRMPHHLVGIIDPDEKPSAAVYVDLARAAIEDVFARDRIPILAGGTGFYFRALSTGLFSVTTPESIRSEVRAMTPTERRERLREIDPGALVAKEDRASAGRIHPNDDYRIGRALEVILATGKPYSAIYSEHLAKTQPSSWRFEGFVLTRERNEFLSSLRERCHRMIAAGLVDEAARIFARYGPCPGLATIGYPQAMRVARGDSSSDSLAEEIFVAHRQFAKRQRTWFRRETRLQAVDTDHFTGMFFSWCQRMRIFH